MPTGRRPLLAVASALLVLVSTALFVAIYSSADRRVPVLVVTSTVQQGQPITSADLGVAQVAASSGLMLIPVSDSPQLAGTWAAVTVPAGSLLTRADLTGTRPVPRGGAVVGLALKAGQLPATGLVSGDAVMVVQTLGDATAPAGGSPVTGGDAGAPSGSAVTPSAGVLVGRARVFQTATPSGISSGSGATELVSVVVPAGSAAAVATAAAGSDVSLVLLSGQGGSSSP